MSGSAGGAADGAGGSCGADPHVGRPPAAPAAGSAPDGDGGGGGGDDDDDDAVMSAELQRLLELRLEATRELCGDVEGLHAVLHRINGVLQPEGGGAAGGQANSGGLADPPVLPAVSDGPPLLRLPLDLIFSHIASQLDGVSLTAFGSCCSCLRGGLQRQNHSELLYRNCVVQEYVPADWLPSLPIVRLVARDRWRNTYRGLHGKVQRDLPRLERVLRALKVLRADTSTVRSSHLLNSKSVGRELLTKRKVGREMHEILSKRVSDLQRARDSLLIQREEWQQVLDDPGTKHHTRDARQELYSRLAASESHCAARLASVGASRRLLANVFTGVHELLRKTILGSGGKCGSYRRRVNALQMLGVQLSMLLEAVPGSAARHIAPPQDGSGGGPGPAGASSEAADWPTFSALGWGLQHGAADSEVSAMLATALQSLFRGARARRKLGDMRAAAAEAVRAAATAKRALLLGADKASPQQQQRQPSKNALAARAAAGSARDEDDDEDAEALSPRHPRAGVATATAAARFDSGLDDMLLQRLKTNGGAAPGSGRKNRRRRNKRRGGAAAAAAGSRGVGDAGVSESDADESV
eukprot:SAG22_NODE_1650_length_3897_cov_2.043181_3_plen_583_part_01